MEQLRGCTGAGAVPFLCMLLLQLIVATGAQVGFCNLLASCGTFCCSSSLYSFGRRMLLRSDILSMLEPMSFFCVRLRVKLSSWIILSQSRIRKFLVARAASILSNYCFKHNGTLIGNGICRGVFCCIRNPPCQVMVSLMKKRIRAMRKLEHHLLIQLYFQWRVSHFFFKIR